MKLVRILEGATVIAVLVILGMQVSRECAELLHDAEYDQSLSQWQADYDAWKAAEADRSQDLQAIPDNALWSEVIRRLDQRDGHPGDLPPADPTLSRPAHFTLRICWDTRPPD